VIKSPPVSLWQVIGFAPQVTTVRGARWTFSAWEPKWLCLTLLRVEKLPLGVECAGPVGLVGATLVVRVVGTGYLDGFQKKK